MYKKTTLDSINRSLRESGLENITAVKDTRKTHSFCLRFDSDIVSDEEMEQAKIIVSSLMGNMTWGEPRTL